MESFAFEKWKKGFYLKEEDIVKMKNIIETRLKEKKIKQSIILTVYREDNFKYQTVETDDILNEENALRNRIIRLVFSINTEEVKLTLDFDKNENVSLSIEAQDKDLTYLLLSDLRQYISTEVCVFHKFKMKRTDLYMIVMPIMLMFFMFAPALMYKAKLNISSTSELLNSTDINLKLNYLIERQKINYDLTEIIFPIGTVILLLVSIAILPTLLHKYFPHYIFYIGKEKNRFDTLIKRRSQIFWGIIVTFLISIIAGFIVNIIQN